MLLIKSFCAIRTKSEVRRSASWQPHAIHSGEPSGIAVDTAIMRSSEPIAAIIQLIGTIVQHKRCRLARHAGLSKRLREQQVTLLENDQGAIVEGYARSIWWAAKLLLGYGEQVKALEHEELVQHMHETTQAVARLYEMRRSNKNAIPSRAAWRSKSNWTNLSDRRIVDSFHFSIAGAYFGTISHSMAYDQRLVYSVQVVLTVGSLSYENYIQSNTCKMLKHEVCL
jgi:hypothetical protein